MTGYVICYIRRGAIYSIGCCNEFHICEIFFISGADLELNSGLLSSRGLRRPNRLAVYDVLKIAALVLAAVIFIHPSSLAYHLTLQWDPNVDGDLAGYILYYGTASRNYQYDIDIGDQTSCTISGLVEGKQYFFSVTAYDQEGNESAFSREVVYPNISSDSTSVNSGDHRTQISCFISSAADGRWAIKQFVAFVGVLLAGIVGLLIYRRVLT